jgi:hypothetical protein
MAAPVQAQSNLQRGFEGALRGCEEWVLNPASWADGVGPFLKTVGLGDQMGLVERVEEVNLPPKQLRKGNHYWRINSTPTAGYILVVSDQLPMCHITGGGDVDLQPVAEEVLGAAAFSKRWEKLSDEIKGEMKTTFFRNREDPDFALVVSRAATAGQRLDRVQVIATAIYQTGARRR